MFIVLPYLLLADCTKVANLLGVEEKVLLCLFIDCFTYDFLLANKEANIYY